MADRDIERLLHSRASLAGVEMPAVLAHGLSQYFRLLERWNRTINLTSLSDIDAAIDRLLVEPVAAARHLPAAARVMDVGSGGGSPAVPLAMALHASSLLMVESKSRKAAFLREAVRQLELRHAVVESTRVEELAPRPDLTATMTVVSVRAIRLNASSFALLKRFLAPGGQIALFRGSEGPEVIDGGPGLHGKGTYPLVGANRSRLSLLELTE